jgi:hypothetical protein
MMLPNTSLAGGNMLDEAYLYPEGRRRTAPLSHSSLSVVYSAARKQAVHVLRKENHMHMALKHQRPERQEPADGHAKRFLPSTGHGYLPFPSPRLNVLIYLKLAKSL